MNIGTPLIYLRNGQGKKVPFWQFFRKAEIKNIQVNKRTSFNKHIATGKSVKINKHTHLFRSLRSGVIMVDRYYKHVLFKSTACLQTPKKLNFLIINTGLYLLL